MPDYSLKKKERISRHSDFITIHKKGESKQTRHFRILICPNDLPWRRFGVTVGRKAGNAVERNRIKRLLREYFRLNKDKFPRSSDVLFIARGGSSKLKYSELSDELNEIFYNKIG